MQIILDVPNHLGSKLQQYEGRLPELLERGLLALQVEQTIHFQDEAAIMTLLASQPSPQQVLAIQPSPELQSKVSELLARCKTSALSISEERELERYLTLEHLVRLAKIEAYKF